MRCADQQWIERMSQPNGTRPTRIFIDSYDVFSPTW